MSKFQWTKEQEKAINTRDKNILVSAAAGSGKTAVLVDRIRKLVSEEGVPISQFLVVTFTKAAASEMKDKLRNSIKGELANDDISMDKSRYLRKQLVDLETANISTFHAFGLSVIKRFFYKLDMEPNLGIIEDTETTLMQDQAMEQLLEREFEEFRDDFVEFLDCYSDDRNLYKIINLIKDGHKSLMSLPHPWEWMEDVIRETENLNKDFENTEIWQWMRGHLALNLKMVLNLYQAVSDTLSDEGYDNFAELFEKNEIDVFRKAYTLVSKSKESPLIIHKELRSILDYKTSIIRPGKDENYKELVKPRVENLRKKAASIFDNDISRPYLSYDLGEMLEATVKTAPALRTFLRLIRSFDDTYKELKKEAQVIDFNDIEHYCLQVLEDEEVRDYYRNHFSQIFIDEYQDTNFLQDSIISMIKRENNLFMVGDIKQSIYRFRLAEPALFQEKYRTFKEQGEDGDSIVIDLNKNHRSKQPIIDYVNAVFKPIMEGYDKDAMLYCGDKYQGELNQDPIIRVVTPNDEAAEGTEDDLDANTREALLIGKIIKENLGKPFYDSKADPPGPRPLEPRDIVILRRSIESYAPTYRTILKEMDIDLQVQGENGYFDTVEIGLFVDLLSVIDNTMRDIPLIGVLHSEIFGFTAKELSEIRIAHKSGSFHDALKAYMEESETELAERCRAAFDRILSWREMSRTMELPRFIWELMIDSGTYAIMGALPNGGQRQSNLRELCNIANRQSMGKSTILYDFLKYIEAIKVGKIKMGEAQEAMNIANAVQFMTIHKSKGLEFPMVILAGANASLIGHSSPFYYHKEIGVGLDYVDKENRWRTKTLMQYLIRGRTEKENLDEMIRLLYVALTRAKDRLFITAYSRDCNFVDAAENKVYGNKRFLEMMAPSVPYEIEYTEIPEEYLGSEASEADENADGNSLGQDEIDAINRILTYEYPNIRARGLKSKYSVTELNKENAYKDEELIKLRPVRTMPVSEDSHTLSTAERGTVYHRIMEELSFASFDGMDQKDVDAKLRSDIEEMIDRGILEDYEAKAIKPEKIRDFFVSNLGQRCISADKKGLLEKERPFTMKVEKDGVNVLVQGIIDCYFHEEVENAPGTYKTLLLDYKSNWIDSSKSIEDEEERLRREYRGQMELYKKALEKAGFGTIEEAYLYLLDIGRGILI